MTYRCIDDDRQLCYKLEAKQLLNDVTALIVDFDGVLVRTFQSYRQAIKNVVDYYLLDILGLDGKRGELVTSQDIQKFKDTGLYNNDWDLSYSLLTYYLYLTQTELQRRSSLDDFLKRFERIPFSNVQGFIQNLQEVGEFLRGCGIGTRELLSQKRRNIFGLDSILAQIQRMPYIQTPGISIIHFLQTLTSTEKETSVQADVRVQMAEKLVPYDRSRPDFLQRLFEEIYLGRELFARFYETPSIFNFRESLLDMEEFIPEEKTLEDLRKRFGRILIYSEKPRKQGLYILEKNHAKKYFAENNVIFYDDILESEETQNGNRENLLLGKPNPALFIKLINQIPRSGKIAYVGDNMADVKLVSNTRSHGLSNLLFIGVLSSSQDPEELYKRYKHYDAEVIVRDLNDIPYLYQIIGDYD